jgi:hypothetical protein
VIFEIFEFFKTGELIKDDRLLATFGFNCFAYLVIVLDKAAPYLTTHGSTRLASEHLLVSFQLTCPDMESAGNSVFKDQLLFFRYEYVGRNLPGPQKLTISSANPNLGKVVSFCASCKRAGLLAAKASTTSGRKLLKWRGC